MRFTIACIAVLSCAISTSAVSIETAAVGDIGNPNDPRTGNQFGGVSYAYSIGKYEVTVGQYTAFLNAVSASDTYELYNTNMATDLNVAGIARSGVSGTYTYSVIGSANHPVTYVSWGDAARFVNWLQNGQPSGAQNSSTTEDGAYTLNGATTDAALVIVPRNANATWVIPTESEWYKAAYYQPAANGGDADGYWAFAMRTNDHPYSAVPPGNAAPDRAHTGNFKENDGFANGYNDGYAVTGSTTRDPNQNYLTDVGAYTSASSYYGTFDQAGNVWEWTEAVVAGSGRGSRGGSFATAEPSTIAFPYSSFENPTDQQYNIGFRVAATSAMPEPSSLSLLLAVEAWLTCWRRLLRLSLPV